MSGFVEKLFNICSLNVYLLKIKVYEINDFCTAIIITKVDETRDVWMNIQVSSTLEIQPSMRICSAFVFFLHSYPHEALNEIRDDFRDVTAQS